MLLSNLPCKSTNSADKRNTPDLDTQLGDCSEEVIHSQAREFTVVSAPRQRRDPPQKFEKTNLERCHFKSPWGDYPITTSSHLIETNFSEWVGQNNYAHWRHAKPDHPLSALPD